MIYNFDSEVDITFDFDFEKVYRDVVDAVLDYFKCPYDYEISLLIVGDDEIRQINNDMRGIDKATDVLSFPNIDLSSDPGNFGIIDETDDIFEPDSGELILGDIVLSNNKIIEQSNEFGHSQLREYAFLIAHSMLHLIGFDHIEESDRIEMEKYQDIIMNILDIKR